MQESSYLGTERTGKLLLKFAVPCIFSLIISCLYNIVDQIFVGNGVGYLGNAATGVIFPITVIGWGVSLFFGDGAAASLSVSLGKNETENIHRSVGNSILFSFLGGLVIILISYLWGDGLLRLIGATDANLSLAHDYGFIIYAMMPLALVQNTLSSIIRADGSPKYAMGAMLVGAVLNIIGDPVAIFVLDMGMHLRGLPHPEQSISRFRLQLPARPSPVEAGHGPWRVQLFDAAVHRGHHGDQ